MPFQQRADDPLDAEVNVRLTAAEKARLLEDADLAALTMSQLIRRRYFGRPIIASADMLVLKELRPLDGLPEHIHNQSGGIYKSSPPLGPARGAASLLPDAGAVWSARSTTRSQRREAVDAAERNADSARRTPARIALEA